MNVPYEKLYFLLCDKWVQTWLSSALILENVNVDDLFKQKSHRRPTSIFENQNLKVKERYCILLPKFFWPTVRKNCSFEIRGLRLRICKSFEIVRTIFSNSERPKQFLVKECLLLIWLVPGGFSQLMNWKNNIGI